MKEVENNEDNFSRLNAGKESFKVPEGFFEELPGKIMDKIRLLEGTETSTSNPFLTPEGYFDSLPVAISDRLTTKKHSSLSSSLSWGRFFKRPVVLIPLVCAILAAGIYLMSRPGETNKLQEITYEDLQNSTWLQSIDEEMLEDVLASESAPETTDSLTQYILDNNIELSDLENAL